MPKLDNSCLTIILQRKLTMYLMYNFICACTRQLLTIQLCIGKTVHKKMSAGATLLLINLDFRYVQDCANIFSGVRVRSM